MASVTKRPIRHGTAIPAPVPQTADNAFESAAPADAIGLLSAFAAEQHEAFTEILADVLTDRHRTVIAICDLLGVAMAQIDHNAETTGFVDRWDLIIDSRKALEQAHAAYPE